MLKFRLILPLFLVMLLPWAVVAQTTPHIHAPIPISGPTEFIAQAFDVLDYDADIDLTAAPLPEMAGVCRIRFRWIGDPAVNQFYFHLRGLVVDSVFYISPTMFDAVPRTAVAVGDPASALFHYSIAAPAGVQTGDTGIITIKYHGQMGDEYGPGTWGGVSSGKAAAGEKILYAMGVGFKNNYVSATQHWLPCYDHPADKATFTGRFRVNNGMTVAGNGLLTTYPEGDSVTVFRWHQQSPASTYLLTFAVAPFHPLNFGTDTLPMVVYSLAGDTAATRVSFSGLAGMVSSLGSRFGHYPFEKVGYVNTPQGSMEHQTMISIAEQISRSRDTVNHTAYHELAHQWFGGLVTPTDFRHAWLNESFATFCEGLRSEDIGGYSGYLNYLNGLWNSYTRSVAPREGVLPLYDFPRVAPSSNYPTTIYYKGALVVALLRYQMGDEKFYQAMRDYLQTYRFGNAGTDSLRAILEKHHGASLQPFFDQWVIGKGWPVIDVSTSQEAQSPTLSRVTVALTQVQKPEYGVFTNLPVELGFRGVDGNFSYRIVTMNSRSETFTIDSVPAFASLTINQGPSLRAPLVVGKTSGAQTDLGNGFSNSIGCSVGPNPTATGKLTIIQTDTAPQGCGGISYLLFDTTGRRAVAGTSNDCQFSIDVSNAPTGPALLRLQRRGLVQDIPVMIAR
ncbi:MAG: hypothetical protein IT211_10140 [Armatimonadetes bacterium]|nr:hypothetical protein [Armatimonadota bacterium]